MSIVTQSLASQETPDYAQFKQAVLTKTGIDLNQYKQQQMHRRLCSMLERVKVASFMEYFRLLERDPNEYATFMDRLTINVSELFRNPEKWDELRDKILRPMLEKKRTLKIWSAGCSYGAEPYTLAVLMEQLTPGVKHTLHATDLDKTILARAREGKFTVADVKNVAPALLDRYFDRLPTRSMPMANELESSYQVKAEMRARIAFNPQNLLADRFDSGYDLICCRNVVIYFTDPAKDKLYARFWQALTPGGVLFVGGTERIFNSRELGFETPLPFFYKRRD